MLCLLSALIACATVYCSISDRDLTLTPSPVSPQIEIRAVFDRAVSVMGSPRLLLDTGTYAAFDGTSEDGTEVRW